MSIGTYGEPDAVSNASDYAKFFSRSHDAVIRVYDDAGNVIKTHEARGRFQRVLSITRLKQKAATRKPSSGSFRRSNGPLAQELPNDFLRVHWSVESQGYWLCAISAAAL
jgi:hypothetical protein